MVIVACCAAWLGSSALAQDAAVRPPRVRELPAVILPANVEMPASGVVEVVVVVAADGSAEVAGCAPEVDVSVCDRVRESVARAGFEPAARGGEPIAARVRLALRVTKPELSPAASPSPSAPAPVAPAEARPPSCAVSNAPSGSAAQPSAAAADDSESGVYGAQARARRTQQPGMRRLELAEMRDMPGSFGDPFRAIEALPGIVPLFSGLPYIFVRGSPPTGTQYFYDDIPVPALFHFALGPAVIHPQMIGPLQLYSGVAPARYGRLTGGAIVAEGPEPAGHDTHAEAQLRLIDVSGYAQADALGGRLALAGRYGYPGLILSLASPDVDVQYWDYQARYALPLTAHARLELVALGSYDAFAQRSDPESRLTLTFHRVESRLVHRAGSDELGAALLFGYERSGLGSQIEVDALKLSPRVWLEHLFDRRSRLRLSVDAQEVGGGLQRNTDPDFATGFGVTGLTHGPRAVLGGQAELVLRPWTALELQLGGRVDAWFQRGYRTTVLDPRGRLILHASEQLDLHVAAGLTHQPAVAYLPLPALVDFADLHHLQRALQTEAGVGWTLADDLRIELQAFAHRYHNLIFSDAISLSGALDDLCTTGDCAKARLPTHLNGSSYGFELFLRRPITHGLSGFISYTLAWSRVDRVLGLPYKPSWDVRHVGNLVLHWELGGGLSVGVRGFLRSGKVDSAFYATQDMQLGLEQRRLPYFWRIDAELAYAWRTSWGKMRFAVEWFNATLSREPAAYDCSEGSMQCTVKYLPTIFVPVLSLRGEH